MTEKGFKSKLTVYTFVMTLFVVMSHWTHYYLTTGLGAGSDAYAYISRLWSLLGSVSLVFFFGMSGFLFMRGVASRADLGGKMLRRLVSLGIPFVAWNLFNLIYNIAYGLYKGSLDIGFTDILYGFSFSPFNSPMWYLLALLLLMCLSPLLLLLKNRPRVTLIVALGTIALAYVLYCLLEPTHWLLLWLKRLLGYLPVYVVGAALALHSEETVTSGGAYAHSRFVTVGAAVLSLAMVLLFVLGGEMSIWLKWPVYQLLPVLMWLSVPSKLLEGVRLSLPLTVSPFVYAMHSVLILILNSLWTQKLFGGVDFPLAVDILFHLLLVGVLWAICLGTAFVLKKLLPERIYKIFAGGSAGRKMY